MSAEDSDIDLIKKLKDLGIPTDKINEKELKGLIFNAQRRFNRYEMYQPGDTFEDRLIRWLYNFNTEDRGAAIDLVKNIRYISRNELRTLAEFVLDLAATLTWQSVIRFYKQEKNTSLSDAFNREMRRNIFIAVSDDIGGDYFRRYGRRRFPQLEKENFIEYYKMGKEDIEEIREKIPNPKRFFLLDQICASGTTALKFKIKDKNPESKGKLRRFFKRWREPIAGKEVYYVPLIASSFVESILRERLEKLAGDVTGIAEIKILSILIVPPSEWLVQEYKGDIKINKSAVKLLETYYNKFSEDMHTLEGEGSLFGVGEGGLSLVVGTNCPNNSLFIIWHAFNNWYPLFPRVAHHRTTTTPFFSDAEKQKQILITNCKRPASHSALHKSSLIELKDVLPTFDLAASINPKSQGYQELIKVLGTDLTIVEFNGSEGINGAVSKVQEENSKGNNMEIRITSNKQTLPPSENFEGLSSQYKLMVPFLSAAGPIHSPFKNLNDMDIIPAVMFPLSGSFSIDSVLAMHSDYIDGCDIRTEKMLYLPAESPAISFRRTVSLLKSYNDIGIAYEKICLLPAYDATSTLVTIAIAGLLNTKIHAPKSLIDQPIFEENNLILGKQQIKESRDKTER